MGSDVSAFDNLRCGADGKFRGGKRQLDKDFVPTYLRGAEEQEYVDRRKQTLAA